MLTGWKWMAFTMLLTLCSLLSKEQGITAVAACFGYDICIEQKVVCMISSHCRSYALTIH